MKKIIYGVLSTVLFLEFIVGLSYMSAILRGVSFNPDWTLLCMEAVVFGLICAFGPDAVQRKKNREKLAKRLGRLN